jgi:hypothetical protein
MRKFPVLFLLSHGFDAVHRIHQIDSRFVVCASCVGIFQANFGTEIGIAPWAAKHLPLLPQCVDEGLVDV